MGRRTHVVSLCLSLLCAGVPGCGDRGVSLLGPGRTPVEVEVETVRPQPVAPTLVFPGKVEPQARISLAFGVEGFVGRFHVSEGERVEAGRPLAVLVTRELVLAAEAARASLESARARLAELAAGAGARTRAQRERLRAEVLEAELTLEAAEARVAAATLRAPVAGHVEERLVEEHEYAAAGVPVVVLAVLETVRVHAALPESALGRFGVGAPVAVRSVSRRGRVFRGRVTQIGVAARPGAGGLPFAVDLPNPDLALLPETSVEVEVAVGPPAEAHSLPREAVLPGVGSHPFSFVVKGEPGNQRVEARPVSLGPVHGDRVVIARGLATGDRVVTRGQRLVTVGDRVRVVSAAR